MKTSKKIIPALVMLLVSAVMMATASFAWFAMNQSVDANGMSVNIKSDSIYLLISSDKTTVEEIQTQNQTVASGVTTDSLDLYPTAHKADATAAEIATVGNWYTKAADSVSSSASTKAEVPLTTFENYVVRYNYYLTLAEGSNDATNLKITEFTIAASGDSAATGDALTVAPVRAILVCGTKVIELNSLTDVAALDPLAATVTDDAVTTVTVYLYYDGNDAAVYTNNIINLEDVDFDFKLGVD